MAVSPMPISVRPAPFDSVAETYDATFTNSLIGRAQRSAVWQELDRCFHPGQRVLELNCGTGVDAIHLGQRGVEVLACDVAAGMIEVARRRLNVAKLAAPVCFRVLATEDIGELEGEGPFDGVFSNFAGLNCVENPSTVANRLAHLLGTDARILLAVFGRFCVWEILWYLGQGNATKAFRRLRTKDKSIAQLADGATFQVFYPSARKLARAFNPHFRLVSSMGIGVSVPPTYAEPLALRFPNVLHAAKKADRLLGRCPIIRSAADHLLLRFERR